MTVVFEDGTDIYFARQLVNERLREAMSRLPDGVEPALGPIATGLGEIFMFTVESQPGAIDEHGRAWDSTSLRTLQDWVIKPQLRTVPGVTEVNSDRRLREGDSRDAAPGATRRARPHLSGSPERDRPKQRRYGRRLHRAQRGAVPGALARSTSRARRRAQDRGGPHRTASRSASATSRRSRSAASSAPAPQPRMAARSCSAPSSC